MRQFSKQSNSLWCVWWHFCLCQQFFNGVFNWTTKEWWWLINDCCDCGVSLELLIGHQMVFIWCRMKCHPGCNICHVLAPSKRREIVGNWPSEKPKGECQLDFDTVFRCCCFEWFWFVFMCHMSHGMHLQWQHQWKPLGHSTAQHSKWHAICIVPFCKLMWTENFGVWRAFALKKAFLTVEFTSIKGTTGKCTPHIADALCILQSIGQPKCANFCSDFPSIKLTAPNVTCTLVFD